MWLEWLGLTRMQKSWLYRSVRIPADLEKSLFENRIHNSAKSLPGVSISALVNETEDLMGLLASGDGQVDEDILIYDLEKVRESLGPRYLQRFLEQGKAVRMFTVGLFYAYKFIRLSYQRLFKK